MGNDDALKKAAKLIRDGKARNIAVLTGLYDNLAALNLPFPEAVFTLDYFEVRPEPFWTLAKDLYPGKYFPTPTHYFLALLHDKGLLQRVWTQNIDTLETAAGVPVDLVLEAHGSFATAHCLACSRSASTEHVVRSGVREGKVVRCDRAGCDGLVKPDIVFFGEGLPPEFFQMKRELFDCDLLLVIGTSLQVEPFASLVHVVDSDVPRVLINREAVGPFARRFNPFKKSSSPKSSRDSVFLGDADEAVRILAAELGWETELDDKMAAGHKTLKQHWNEREKKWLGADESEEEEEQEEEAGESESESEPEVADQSAAASTPPPPPLAEAKPTTPTAAAVPAADGSELEAGAGSGPAPSSPSAGTHVAGEGEDTEVDALAESVARVEIKDQGKDKDRQAPKVKDKAKV